jgi:hypothetical protein
MTQFMFRRSLQFDSADQKTVIRTVLFVPALCLLQVV